MNVSANYLLVPASLDPRLGEVGHLVSKYFCWRFVLLGFRTLV